MIDDCSSDDSREIMQEYSKKDDRFVCVYNSENIGVSHTRNKGIKISDGEYIAFVDSDDWWEKDMLSSLMREAETEGADIVQCRYMYNYKTGEERIPAGVFRTG